MESRVAPIAAAGSMNSAATAQPFALACTARIQEVKLRARICATARGPGGVGETGALRCGVQRRETQRARSRRGGPRPCSAKDRSAAGFVPRDSVVRRRGRNPCASAWRKSRQGCCASTPIWHQISGRQIGYPSSKLLLSIALLISSHAASAHHCRSPHAAHKQIRLRALTAQAARRATRGDRSTLQDSGDGHTTPRTDLHRQRARCSSPQRAAALLHQNSSSGPRNTTPWSRRPLDVAAPPSRSPIYLLERPRKRN